MGMLFLAVGIVVVAGICGGLCSDKRRKTEKVGAGLAAMLTTLLLVGVAFGLVSFCIGVITIDDAVRQTVFYDVNAAHYEQTVAELEQGLASTDSGMFDAKNLMQIQGYKETIAERRDAVVAFNFNLAKHLYWQDNFWIGCIYKNVPSHVRIIAH